MAFDAVARNVFGGCKEGGPFGPPLPLRHYPRGTKGSGSAAGPHALTFAVEANAVAASSSGPGGIARRIKLSGQNDAAPVAREQRLEMVSMPARPEHKRASSMHLSVGQSPVRILKSPPSPLLVGRQASRHFPLTSLRSRKLALAFPDLT
jgi:hypothetical protein